MATHKLLLLPGDGIGPEVMAEVKRLIDWLNAQGIAHFETEQGLVGGSAYDASQQSITDATMAVAKSADAVIFGAVGGPKWDAVPYDARPEAGLLRLRKDLGLFANLRPAVVFGPLVTPGSQKGTHGYFPEHPEMRATLIIEGPGVRQRGSLGEVDMRDIAPTIAKLLEVPLPSADGRPLF